MHHVEDNVVPRRGLEPPRDRNDKAAKKATLPPSAPLQATSSEGRLRKFLALPTKSASAIARLSRNVRMLNGAGIQSLESGLSAVGEVWIRRYDSTCCIESVDLLLSQLPPDGTKIIFQLLCCISCPDND